jgi:hypothetical protein
MLSASLGVQYWIGTLGSAVFDISNAVAVSSTGDVYLAGSSTGGGLQIAKYSSVGVIQWQRKLGTGGGAYGIALDSSDNVHITGDDASRWFIAKYNSSGTIQWQRQLGGGAPDKGYAITTDSSSNVYVCGESLATGTRDIIVAKYNSSGTIQWQRKLDTFSYSIAGEDSGYGVAVDTSSNVYICGIAEDAAGTWDMFIAKYNTSGTIQWQRTLDIASQNLYAFAIAVDSSGNPHITGSSRNAGVQAIAVIKYNTSGTLQWQRVIENSGGNYTNTAGNGISIDSSSNVYINGVCNQTGTVDFQMAKYNSSGTIQWQRRIGSGSADYGQAVAVNGSKVYVTGYTNAGGNNNWLFAQLPNDGSKTGTYTVDGSSFTYASTSLTEAAGTLTSSTSSVVDSAAGLGSTTSSLTDAATTLTSNVTTIT